MRNLKNLQNDDLQD